MRTGTGFGTVLALAVLVAWGGARAEAPTESAELLPWLEKGAYREWSAESGIHRSEGPHFGRVRTFFSPRLVQSMGGTGGGHPRGVAAVKELYGSVSEEVIGWAVAVKKDFPSADGAGWYWYEVMRGMVYADGRGAGQCVGCHMRGVDFILTPWPLR